MLYALDCGSAEDDAVESPDLLEFFMGHILLSEDGVGDGDYFIGHFEYGNAMVEEECISYDRQCDCFVWKLSDGVEVAELTFESVPGVAVIEGFVKAPG